MAESLVPGCSPGDGTSGDWTSGDETSGEGVFGEAVSGTTGAASGATAGCAGFGSAMILQHGFGDRGCRRHRWRNRRRCGGRRGVDMGLGRRCLDFFGGLWRWFGGFARRRRRRYRNGTAPRSQGKAGEEIHQRQRRHQEIGRGAELRPQHEFGRRRAEHDQRQQMVGEIFRAGARALDDFGKQQQDGEREQHVAQRHRPFRARHQRQLHQRIGERHVGHQEDDDVVDRERNQKQRKTDHGYRAFLG